MRRVEVHAQRVAGAESPYAVIAHARRAMKRGRRPSMMYRNERNPRVALRMALADIGATMDDLHVVDLRESKIPVFVTPNWLREMRSWTHCMRRALQALAIPYVVPGPLNDHMVVRLRPHLLDLAGNLGLPMPRIRRLPARTGWFDATDPRPFMLSELHLRAVLRFFRPGMM